MSTLISALLLIISTSFLPVSEAGKIPTANDVVEQMKENLTCQWRMETVDTFKSGNPEDKVTGVACTFTATVEFL